eukprot:232564_1
MNHSERTNDAGVTLTEITTEPKDDAPSNANPQHSEKTALSYPSEREQSQCEKITRQLSGFLVLSIIYVIGISVVLGRFNHFPEPKASSVSSVEFSEDRAYKYLEYMVKDIGVRRSIPDRNATAYYIYQQMLAIKEASEYSDLVTVGITNSRVGYVQKQFKNRNYTVNDVWLYVNLTQNPHSEYILISGHFDTQPNTVGCNDDALPSSAIIELASVYSSFSIKDLSKYNYNVLFVTVDGEEAGNLPGPRALFWATTRPPMVNPNTTLGTPRLAWNVESTGKGKHMAYRSNSDWIIREYLKCAAEPFATSIAQSVLTLVGLQLGTDAVIYAHHTHTLGMASLEDHWVYHTPLDNCKDSYVTGSLQSLGDNAFACFEHFLTMEVGSIPLDGFNVAGTLSNNEYWSDPINNSEWTIPYYSRSPSISNDLLFYSILYSSGFAVPLETVRIYHIVCCIIFLLINLAILFANSKSDKMNTILRYDETLFKFNAVVQGLILANFLLSVGLCCGVTEIMTLIRPSSGANPSCKTTGEGTGHCYETYWRGLTAIYTFTLIVLVFLITYTFQFIIAKLNAKRETPYHWRDMEKIVYLNNNIFICIAAFLLTVISYFSPEISGHKHHLTLTAHLSYAAFWWALFCTVGAILMFVLFYTNVIKKGTEAKRVLLKELIVNAAYILFYLFPALLSFEFVFTMIPIMLGFENWIQAWPVGAIAGVMIPNVVMTYSSLLQRHIMKVYKYAFGFLGATFVVGFILCCALPAHKMEEVVGYEYD